MNIKLVKRVLNYRLLIVLITLIILIAIGYYLNRTSLIKNEEISSNLSVPTCNRTSRLENTSNFDRALSIIYDKYSSWENLGIDNYLSFYFFSPQLINCIKIIESDIRNKDGLEGYFIFNDTDIRDDYFPIYVDHSYKESDDLVTALLLVHEITHVRQYIDSLDGKDTLSCIEKEAEAFYATQQFSKFLGGENQKTLDLRIKFDEELHPQLQTIKTISEEFQNAPRVSLIVLCEGAMGNECSDRISKFWQSKIKEIISKEDYYKSQCNI